MEKTHQVVWDSLLDFGRLEWQWTLMCLEKTPNFAYDDAFKEFDNVWCVKGLIVACSNLMVTHKVRPLMGIIS